MNQQQIALKEQLTFNREIIEIDGKETVKMSTEHNGIYRQMLYAHRKDFDYAQVDDEVKNTLTASLWRELKSKV